MEESIEQKLEELREVWEEAKQGGGEERLQKQRDRGKMTARERIDYLVDEGTFREIDPFVTHRCHDFGMEEKKFLGDGVVTGAGEIRGRLVYLVSEDFSVVGGSLGEMHADKIKTVQKKARQNRVPFIQINDSGGARIQEGIRSLNGYGKIFRENTLASGVIPQISCILGPCAGGAVYSPALTDYVFMVDEISNMFLTGPDVIEQVMGEEVTKEELGGAQTHTEVTGNADRFFQSDEECLDAVKQLLRYLPDCFEDQPVQKSTDDPVDRQTEKIKQVVPADTTQAFDMRDVIKPVLDEREFFEIKPNFAQNAIVGLGRLGGYTVGLVGNQSRYQAGCLDIDSADKIARFVRHCDTMNIPLINFVDVPGFLPGVDQEHGGVIRHGAKMLYVYAEATVPKISLIVRRAYGGAYIAMASRDMGFDSVMAFPTAEIAVMGAEQAANVIFEKEIKEADDSEAKRQQVIERFREKFAKPYNAAEAKLVDTVIDPVGTRKNLSKTLTTLIRKQEQRPEKDHGNIPL